MSSQPADDVIPAQTIRRRWVGGVLGLLLVLGAAVWAWVHVPDLYPAPPPGGDPAVAATRDATRSQAVVTTRASVLAALAGLGALVTIAINYRNSETTNRTFRITQRGHLTDRYTKAVEQLGSTELAVRLGGIYGLQQFATETEHIRDQVSVVEILSAVVRTSLNSVDRPEEEQPRRADYWPGAAPAEVLAAMSVLAQLPDRTPLRADFSGADFDGFHLGQVRLRRGNLRGAVLVGAHLAGVDLDGVVLDGADLRGAVLRGVDLRGASLRGADLTAVVRGATPTRTELAGADLSEADLSGAKLDEADLRHATLSNAHLNDAHLINADLGQADLRGTDLSTTDLLGARLHSADLHGVALRPGQLSPDQLGQVKKGSKPWR